MLQKVLQRSGESQVGTGNHIQKELTIFLDALAALGLPWLLTYLLTYFTHLLTVLSLGWIQSLPAFQTKPQPHKTDGGLEKTWPNQQKDNDKDNDKDNNKYI